MSKPLISLSIKPLGFDQLAARLAALQETLKDLRPFWREVFAPKFFGQVQDRFAGGLFDAARWAPLSPRYKIWKDLNYPGQPILVRTRELRESMTWNGNDAGPGGVFQATPMRVVAGTAVSYGVYHETGTARMPARPFEPVADSPEWTRLMEIWIRAEAARVGFRVR